MLILSAITILRNIFLSSLALMLCFSGVENQSHVIREIQCREESLMSKQITYTPTGQLATVVQPGDSGVYSYTGDSILLRRYFSDNNSSILHLYRTDALGRVMSEMVYDEKENPLTSSTFVYTLDGHLDFIHTKNLRTNTVFRFVFSYVNGDPVKMEVHLNEQLLRTFHYSYNEGYKNLLGLSQEVPGFPIFHALNGDSPIGKPSTHLLKERIVIEANQDTTEHVVYLNKTAADSTLATQTVKNLTTGSVIHYDYRY